MDCLICRFNSRKLNSYRKMEEAKQKIIFGDLGDIYLFMYELTNGNTLCKLTSGKIRGVLRKSKEFVIIKLTDKNLRKFKKWIYGHSKAVILIKIGGRSKFTKNDGIRFIEKKFKKFKKCAYQIKTGDKKSRQVDMWAMLMK